MYPNNFKIRNIKGPNLIWKVYRSGLIGEYKIMNIRYWKLCTDQIRVQETQKNLKQIRNFA